MKVFGLDYGATWFDSCKRALEKEGHEVRGGRALFNPDETLKGEKEIIEGIKAFRPDFVLMYNFLGIMPCFLQSPKGGAYINSRLFTYLQKGKIPCVAWFLDDPLQSNANLWIIRQTGGEGWLKIFCCDRAYVRALEDMSIRSRFLPHCTDPHDFSILVLNPEERAEFSCPVSFVGASKVDETRERRMFLETFIKEKAAQGFDEKKLGEGLEESIGILIQNPTHGAEQTVKACLKSRDVLLPEMKKGSARLFFPIIEWIATSERRIRLIKSLIDYGLMVYGDRAWPKVIPEDHFRGPIDYRGNTVKLYNATKINLNITRSQIRTAVTQRIFDVSASGGFLLTDYRKDFERYFKPGLFIFYDGEADLSEKTAYYLDRPDECRQSALAAMEEVRKNHTYENRMKDLVRMLASDRETGL